MIVRVFVIVSVKWLLNMYNVNTRSESVCMVVAGMGEKENQREVCVCVYECVEVVVRIRGQEIPA